MTDVFVIGAGPAGSYLAYYLSRNSSLEVIVADKKRIIYEPVVCGELIPTAELLKDWIPKSLYEYLLRVWLDSVRDEYILAKVRTARLIINDEEVASFDFPTYVIDKARMIGDLMINAVVRGVKLMTESIVTGCIEEGRLYKCRIVCKEEGEVFVISRYLVGADAYPSIVDISLDVSRGFKDEDLIIATSARARGNYDEDEVLLIIDPRIAPGGFAWIFPRKGEFNVGIGVRCNIAWRSPNAILDRHLKFVSRFGLRQTTPLLSKTLPVGGLINRPYRDRAFLIGDAVGAVIPTNGAGIHPAMITARVLGECIIGRQNYGERLYSIFGGLMRRTMFMRKAADPLLFDHMSLEKAVRLLRRLLTGCVEEAILSSTKTMTYLKYLMGFLTTFFLRLRKGQFL